MNSEEFQHLVMHLRQVGVDTQTCEVKESADKLSSSLVETLSVPVAALLSLGSPKKMVSSQ